MRTLRVLVVIALLAAMDVPSPVRADAPPTNAGGLLGGPPPIPQVPGVDAAGLVRAVRESERWIHQVDSLYLRMESVWTSCGVDAVGAGPRARPDESGQPRGVAPTGKGLLEYAFDHSRLRFLDEQPGQCGTLKVWDGKQLVTRETATGRRESYALDAAPQGNLEDIFAAETAWPRSQPHSFWWDSRDVEELLPYYGRPEEFKCIAREDYRGVPCHVLAMWPTEVRAILFGQSYECDSGANDQQTYGLIGEVRGLVDQSCRWYVGIEDGLLHGILWSIGDKPRLEHWMSDYRQVKPGWWFPMTQGYQIYKKDSAGATYVDSRRDLKVQEIKLNEPLPEERFRVEMREGARVEDRRSGRAVVYEYRPQPPELLGKPLPPLNESFTALDFKPFEAKPLLLCFGDINQRPSRHCLLELAGQSQQLGDVQIVAIQTTQADRTALDHWAQDNDIPFPIIGMTDNPDKTLRTWNVRSLPWLILTDQNHIVRANGFGLRDLGAQLAEVVGQTRQLASAR